MPNDSKQCGDQSIAGAYGGPLVIAGELVTAEKPLPFDQIDNLSSTFFTTHE
jgi:hypothetical protein